MRHTILLLTLLQLLALVGTADAEPADSSQNISVTTDGLVLVGIADLTVEKNVAPHVGVGATVGGGAIMFDPTILMWLAGVNANYYLERKFSGWHVGSQAKYIGAFASDSMSDSHLFGSGVGVAAYGGYKWMRPSGFTALVDAGIAAGSIAISDGSQKARATLVGTMLNVGIGYSF